MNGTEYVKLKYIQQRTFLIWACLKQFYAVAPIYQFCQEWGGFCKTTRSLIFLEENVLWKNETLRPEEP